MKPPIYMGRQGRPVSKEEFERDRQSRPEALGCPHRGEQIGEEQCKLCGGKERLETVYECAVYGKCTLRRYTRKQANRQAIERGDVPAVCCNCEHREASGNKNV